jgi:uncharacterized membrane protein
MKLNRALIYMAMVGGVLFILALIFAPSIEALCKKPPGISALSYLFFQPVCHQDPARSFWLAGMPLPVCARCLGIYLGAFLGLLVFGLMRGVATRRPLPRLWLILGLVPLFADGLFNTLQLFTTPIYLRASIGIFAGAVIAGALIPAINQMLDLFHSRPNPGDEYAQP